VKGNAPVQTMKLQKGSKENSTHSGTPHYAEVSGQFHVPAGFILGERNLG